MLSLTFFMLFLTVIAMYSAEIADLVQIVPLDRLVHSVAIVVGFSHWFM